MTAIVGPSGSGKTTMCSLIARFWDVHGGQISIGGRDVRDYTLDSLLANISMVFQNVYLFDDTIENNIKFGKPDATHEEVVEAAKRACCDDFIQALPDGYNTMIGEGGSSLSGGEKQRLSIARAMLKDAPIVIFDDEGISGTNTKKREEFNWMVADCRAGKIDRIITKSISRFARNTLDCLNYVRELKALGIGITFEKENIDTLDAKGEVLLTILSSLA